MDIQINTDSNVEGGEKFLTYVSGVVQQAFSRFSDQLSHVDIHFSDQNNSKEGFMDKRCLMEVRIKGRKSAVVTNDADSVDEALNGATEKMQHSLEHTLVRTNKTVKEKLYV